MLLSLCGFSQSMKMKLKQLQHSPGSGYMIGSNVSGEALWVVDNTFRYTDSIAILSTKFELDTMRMRLNAQYNSFQTNFIQNQTSSPQAAGFNVSGNGIVGGVFWSKSVLNSAKASYGVLNLSSATGSYSSGVKIVTHFSGAPTYRDGVMSLHMKGYIVKSGTQNVIDLLLNFSWDGSTSTFSNYKILAAQGSYEPVIKLALQGESVIIYLDETGYSEIVLWGENHNSNYGASSYWSTTVNTAIGATTALVTPSYVSVGGGSPSLNNTYIGVGNASNLLSGSSDLTFDGSIFQLNKPSGVPYMRIVRGGTLSANLAIPTSNLTFTGTDFKDMPVLLGTNPGLGLVSNDNGIKINSAGSAGIEFWAGYGEKLRLSNSGVVFPSLATWGAAKLATIGYGGALGTMDIPVVPTVIENKYSPTLANLSNTSNGTVSNALYTRVGNMVDVYVTGTIDISAMDAVFTITLPAAKDLVNLYDLIGEGTALYGNLRSTNLIVAAETSQDKAKITFTRDLSGNAPPSNTYEYTIHFRYKL